MKSSKFIFCVLLLTTVFVCVGIAAAPPLSFTFKDVHANKSATETDSYAINKAGVIAGDYIDSAGVQHGMILAGTKLTTVNNKNCISGIAFYGINSAGVAAGWCTGSSGQPIAFTWSKNKFTNITIPKSSGAEATGINDKGAVVGLYVDSTGSSHGFVKVGTKITKLNIPGDTNTVAWGINNSGLITAYAITSAGDYDSRTTINNGKSYKKFGYPKAGPVGTVIHTPNNNGDIVATYFDTANGAHGVLFHAGKYYSFDDPKASNSTRGDGLNDKLGIVGRYTPSTGGNFGFFAQAK